MLRGGPSLLHHTPCPQTADSGFHGPWSWPGSGMFQPGHLEQTTPPLGALVSICKMGIRPAHSSGAVREKRGLLTRHCPGPATKGCWLEDCSTDSSLLSVLSVEPLGRFLCQTTSRNHGVHVCTLQTLKSSAHVNGCEYCEQ